LQFRTPFLFKLQRLCQDKTVVSGDPCALSLIQTAELHALFRQPMMETYQTLNSPSALTLRYIKNEVDQRGPEVSETSRLASESGNDRGT
jgi:hypothetical protein